MPDQRAERKCTENAATRAVQELRVKGSYLHHKEIKAAQGVKIAAQGLESAVAGTQMYVVGPNDDAELLKEEVMADMQDIFSSVDRGGALVGWLLALSHVVSNTCRDALMKTMPLTVLFTLLVGRHAMQHPRRPVDGPFSVSLSARMRFCLVCY